MQADEEWEWVLLEPQAGAQPVLGVRTCTPAFPASPSGCVESCALMGSWVIHLITHSTDRDDPSHPSCPPEDPQLPRQTRISPMRDFLNFHLKLFKDMESSRKFPKLAASRMERKGSM